MFFRAIYRPNGQIVAVTSVQENNDDEAERASYAAQTLKVCPIVEADVPTAMQAVLDDTAYVVEPPLSDPMLVLSPVSPGELYEFNFATKQWEFPAEKLAALRQKRLLELADVLSVKSRLCTYESVVYDIDAATEVLLRHYSTALAAHGDFLKEAGNRPEWPGIKDAAGVFHIKSTFAAEVVYVRQLLETVSLRRAGCFSRANVHANAIKLLTDPNDLMLYDVTTGWEF